MIKGSDLDATEKKHLGCFYTRKILGGELDAGDLDNQTEAPR